jgi:ribulose-phosphate 3-epimerase
MKIIPAILAKDIPTFLTILRQAESFSDFVQIDIMDGIFVPSKSFRPEEINGLDTSLSFELHLMVKDPGACMASVGDSAGLKKVHFHFEADVDHKDFIAHMKARGLSVGLAVSPETPLSAFREIAGFVNTILFLTVDPGCYGSPFKPEVLEKISATREVFPDKEISVDGGVSLDNLHLFHDLGVDSVCVGSGIFLAKDPADSYNHFIIKARELEKQQPVNRETPSIMGREPGNAD